MVNNTFLASFSSFELGANFRNNHLNKISLVFIIVTKKVKVQEECLDSW